MDFKFSKGSEQHDAGDQQDSKKSQSAKLVLLVILLGGFGYVYFFTGLIKPQQEPPPVAPPPQQVVKKPLPPRDGTAAPAETAVKADTAAKAAAPVKNEAPKTAAVPAAPAAKTAATVPAPKPVAAAKPAPAAAVPKVEAPKPVEKKAAEKKPALAAVKAPDAKKTAATAPVAAAVSDKGGAAKAADAKAPAASKAKKPAVARSVDKPEPNAKPASNGPWQLVVGNYVLEEALATDLVKVRKAGLEANVQSAGRKKAAMNRLQVAEFGNRTAAQAELEKLKKYTSDGFVIDHGGKFVVYAGSYLLDARAASERERLAAAGYRLTLKHVEVALPSRLLTAGSFTDKKTADAALKKLKSAGLTATLKQQ